MDDLVTRLRKNQYFTVYGFDGKFKEQRSEPAAALSREAEDHIQTQYEKIATLTKERDEARERVRVLDAAVANFLDAETAWSNDELDEASYVAALAEMKAVMYRARAAKVMENSK